MTITLPEHPTTEAGTEHDRLDAPIRAAAPGRRGNRQRAAAGVVATAAVLLAAAALLDSGSEEDSTEVRSGSAGPALPSTTAIVGPHIPTSAPGPIPPVTPAAERDAPTVTSAPDAASSNVAPVQAQPAAPVCRNSTDPVCGPFRWDPAPTANQPLTVTFEVSPAQPRAGEEVTVRVLAVDPDAPVTTNGGTYFWDDPHFTGAQIGFPYTVERTADRYGAWTPPKAEPGRLEMTLTHTFAQPGIYRFHFKALSGDQDDPGNTDAHPYASNPEVASVQIIVGPAAQPTPTG